MPQKILMARIFHLASKVKMKKMAKTSSPRSRFF
jgi:hypothetical protein